MEANNQYIVLRNNAESEDNLYSKNIDLCKQNCFRSFEFGVFV